jgi:hypothetical protein
MLGHLPNSENTGMSLEKLPHTRRACGEQPPQLAPVSLRYCRSGGTNQFLNSVESSTECTCILLGHFIKIDYESTRAEARRVVELFATDIGTDDLG